jgi:outer membrane immunogenic protein
MRNASAAIAAATFLIASPQFATAADIPTKMPMKAPPPVAYDWNGFYIGGYYGASTGTVQGTTPNLTTGEIQLNKGGVTAGATVGYNWQFHPQWLVGVEGDLGWLGINQSVMNWNDFARTGQKADWYGTARLRFGYVTGPSLLYVTGGGAFVHFRDTLGNDPAPTTHTETNAGWTAGGGIETKLSRAWTAKTEYLFVDAGNSSFTSNVFGGPFQTNFDHHRYHVIKAGLNYKLGEPMDGLPLLGNSRMLPSNHNWSGFYVGVNAGGGISNVHVVGGGGTLGTNSEEDVNGTGWAAGGQAGYNYIFMSRFLVGVEGDYGYLGVRGSSRDWNDTVRFSDKTNWYGTARARIGTTTGPALLYFTGGAAWVKLTDTEALIGATSTESRTAHGWTFGGGTEVALDAHWSARVESLYIDVGNDARAVGAARGTFKDRFTVVRAGLNYTFGN